MIKQLPPYNNSNNHDYLTLLKSEKKRKRGIQLPTGTGGLNPFPKKEGFALQRSCWTWTFDGGFGSREREKKRPIIDGGLKSWDS